jgi:hypothetical protein
MQFVRQLLLLSVWLLPALSLRAQDKPALTFENLGLKNNYRVVFEQWDETNHFASGALEISNNENDVVHTRIPFTADVKTDTKDKKTEVLTVRCTALELFFPPANKKDPYPSLTWKLTNRKSKDAKLKASLWAYGKNAWALDELDLDKAEEKK